MSHVGSSRVPISIGATVQVFCVHNQEKRSIKQLEFDLREFSPNICSCCENMFLTKLGEITQIWCPECHPQNNERGKHG